MNQMTAQGQTPTPAQTRPRGRIRFDLMDPDAFAHIQRVAALYAASPLFPEHLRKDGPSAATANAVLCMNIADRLNEDALTVAQNIYFVGGKPGWSATYMIAKANMFGAFNGPIEWTTKGEGEGLEVTASAVLTSSGKKVSKTITFQNAKDDGWTRNAKYKSMPETMLQYRSATALIRLYCPEVMIGMPVSVELEDTQASSEMRDITPQETADDFDPIEDTREVKKPKAKPAARKVDRTPPKPAKDPAEAEVDDAEVDDAKVDDAETIDPETGEVLEGKDETDAKPEPEVKGETKAQDQHPDIEQFNNLVRMIEGDLEVADATQVYEMYKAQIVQMKSVAPAAYENLPQDIRTLHEG